MEEGGDGDGSFAGRHPMTEASGILFLGCLGVIIGVKSRNSVEKRLTIGTKFVCEGEADAAPVAIIGGDVGGRPLYQDGQGLDGISDGSGVGGLWFGHDKAGLM